MPQNKQHCSRKLNDTLADIYTPLLYQHWYVAAKKTEITRQLSSRYILERNILFYRKQDGAPVALQNRCAHRSFPLSESILQGDDIICGYHGIRYNSKGIIVDVPCQKTCPNNTGVRAYPLKEAGPLVWIWMGDPDKADEGLIPDVSFLDSPEWAYASGQYKVDGSYLLMHENLCDLTHFAYLHGSSFTFTRKHAELPVEVEKQGKQIRYFRKGQVSDAKVFFPPYYQMDKREADTISGGSFISPALSMGWRETELTDLIENEPRVLKTFVPHFLTPETKRSCHYFWFFARNYALNDQMFGDSFQATITRGFNEDMFAVREMQHMLENDRHDFREIHIAGDQPGNIMRRVLKQYADAERDN